MFSRPSIRIRASDLYRGVIRLTMVIDSTAAAMVGTRIQRRLRSSACQIRRRSRSPATAAGLAVVGAATFGASDALSGALSGPLADTFGALTSFSISALSLPARQNAKRITRSHRTPLTRHPTGRDYTPLRLPPG